MTFCTAHRPDHRPTQQRAPQLIPIPLAERRRHNPPGPARAPERAAVQIFTDWASI
ncbi:MAG: hypothetical protein LJE68_03195 [Rhodobacter sp.]|nr:hypothetical protein [Rhodobacter sp.]